MQIKAPKRGFHYSQTKIQRFFPDRPAFAAQGVWRRHLDHDRPPCKHVRSHTDADSFSWGFKIIVPTDGTEAFTEEDYQGGLTYFKQVYGADIKTVDDIIKDF